MTVSKNGTKIFQNIELEIHILGTFLLEESSRMYAIDILHPRHFYKGDHQFIYQALLSLFHAGKSINIHTLENELKSMGKLKDVGGVTYLTSLTEYVVPNDTLETYIQIVIEYFIRREANLIGNRLSKGCASEEESVYSTLEQAEKELLSLSRPSVTSLEDITSIVSRQLKKIENLGKKEGSLIGITSGFKDLDDIVRGWQKPDFVVVAARPGMGKTSFLLSCAENAAFQNKPVAFFSLEMSKEQLCNRLFSHVTGLPLEKFQTGNLSNDNWAVFYEKVEFFLKNSTIYIDDTPSLSLRDFRLKARFLKSRYDIGLLIVDYIQLMVAEVGLNSNREQEISAISRELKSIAKELDIPLIAASQLNRAVEHREGNRPRLSDIRESGAIEQDADIVMFLYRPKYYKTMEALANKSLEDFVEVIVAKHRNGDTGCIKLCFDGSLTRFSDFPRKG